MRRLYYSSLLLGTVTVLLARVVAPALAATSSAGPAQWAVTSVAGPAHFKPASSGDVYVVTATNVGGESTSGPVSITDTLHGEAEATAVEEGEEIFTEGLLSCTLSPPSTVTCGYSGRVDPGDTLRFRIKVDVTAKEGEVENTATVSGGGAASASTSEPTTRPTPVTSEPVPFGVASFFTAASTPQAGSHPNLTTAFTLNWSEIPAGHAQPLPPASPRDFHVDLPPGLTGDPLAVPRCDIGTVRREECDEDAAVGVATPVIKGSPRVLPLVYNITPYPGEPAAFAFSVVGGVAAVRLDTSVVPHSDGEYAIHVSVADVNEAEPILASSVTLWGVPSQYNGPGPDTSSVCPVSEGKATCVKFGGPGGQAALARPFLRNPTSCAGSGALSAGLQMDSWPEPGRLDPNGTPDLSDSRWKTTESRLLAPSGAGLTECGLLAPLFTPSLQVAPDTARAGAPAGYSVSLEVPQSESSQRLATPDLRDATVTLPAGTVASPSAANGLEACSDSQLDSQSIEPASCPNGSQIGTVRIKTPLLEEELTGQVFLGQPQCSPCGPSEAAEGKMVRLFLQAHGSGVRIKLAGRTEINQQTGQLTTVFEQNPQQPFEKLTLRLDGGPGAPLANPSVCGTATTTSLLIPWSSTPVAPFAAEPSSSFQVEGCAAAPFAPSFAAGMTATLQAGAYSPFSVTFSRTDQDQSLGGIAVHTPPGLLGAVSHVTACGEPLASQGACGSASQIGTVAAAAGPGPAPFWITGGRAYLTGPYHGAPYGLSIVVPTVAGPFNLGEEHLRAAIYVDPHTSALTVVSDPLPTIKDGIPFQVKTVNVNVNRSEFTFNATSCDTASIAARISSTAGAAVEPSYPYQAVNCANLPFKPSFTVSTQAKTSKANGASLDVRVAQKLGEANIHKVDVSLPHALPSRLTTIQKACPEAQFAANPAGCAVGSNVGTATARTPVLNAPLTGPAYLVSHGGAAFPDLDIVLQGEGITIDLVGNTNIKNGITFSRFETVPDAPISAFELNLPESPHSALTANANLCAVTNVVSVRKRVALRRHGHTVHVVRSVTRKVPAALLMPTTLIGQNGAQVKQTTKIAVSGCGKPKSKAKPKSRAKRNKRGKRAKHK
jgi:hypothetical protein